MLSLKGWIIFASYLVFLSITTACQNVEIVSRSAWEARAARLLINIASPVQHVIIGHTVTAECHTKGACAATMRNMQNYHMDDLGWSDIGYNFVIGGDGRVYEGVGWTREGIHTYGWNRKSIGIGFVGNFMSVTPSTEMLSAARSLIVCGIQNGNITQAQIHGARDATCTLSPGDKLYEIIREWPRFIGGPLPGYKC